MHTFVIFLFFISFTGKTVFEFGIGLCVHKDGFAKPCTNKCALVLYPTHKSSRDMADNLKRSIKIHCISNKPFVPYPDSFTNQEIDIILKKIEQLSLERN